MRHGLLIAGSLSDAQWRWSAERAESPAHVCVHTGDGLRPNRSLSLTCLLPRRTSLRQSGVYSALSVCRMALQMISTIANRTPGGLPATRFRRVVKRHTAGTAAAPFESRS